MLKSTFDVDEDNLRPLELRAEEVGLNCFELLFQEYDRLPNTGYHIQVCRMVLVCVCVTSNERYVLLLIACSVT